MSGSEHGSTLASSVVAGVWEVISATVATHAVSRRMPRQRAIREVPDTEAEQSAEKLGRVFVDSRRMLKDDGLLVLTCHHSRRRAGVRWPKQANTLQPLRMANRSIRPSQCVPAPRPRHAPVSERRQVRGRNRECSRTQQLRKAARKSYAGTVRRLHEGRRGIKIRTSRCLSTATGSTWLSTGRGMRRNRHAAAREMAEGDQIRQSWRSSLL